MIESTATHQESDDDDDDGDRTAQRVFVANKAPLGASLLEFPQFPLSGDEYRGWGGARGPGLSTGVRAFVDGRAVGYPGWWPQGATHLSCYQKKAHSSIISAFETNPFTSAGKRITLGTAKAECPNNWHRGPIPEFKRYLEGDQTQR